LQAPILSLRIAHSFSQHLAQLSLGLRRFAAWGCHCVILVVRRSETLKLNRNAWVHAHMHVDQIGACPL
jgi:hypothetical protein